METRNGCLVKSIHCNKYIFSSIRSLSLCIVNYRSELQKKTMNQQSDQQPDQQFDLQQDLEQFSEAGRNEDAQTVQLSTHNSMIDCHVHNMNPSSDEDIIASKRKTADTERQVMNVDAQATRVSSSAKAIYA